MKLDFQKQYTPNEFMNENYHECFYCRTSYKERDKRNFARATFTFSALKACSNCRHFLTLKQNTGKIEAVIYFNQLYNNIIYTNISGIVLSRPDNSKIDILNKPISVINGQCLKNIHRSTKDKYR